MNRSQLLEYAEIIRTMPRENWTQNEMVNETNNKFCFNGYLLFAKTSADNVNAVFQKKGSVYEILADILGLEEYVIDHLIDLNDDDDYNIVDEYGYHHDSFYHRQMRAVEYLQCLANEVVTQ
jgi:hypothetical protein